MQLQPGTPTKTSISINNAPVLDFKRQQELTYESFARMINNPILQAEKPTVVYHDIIQDTLVPKLQESVENLDVKTHDTIIKSLSTVKSYKDSVDHSKDVIPTKIIKSDLTEIDDNMLGAFDKMLSLVDDSIESLIEEDPVKAQHRLHEVVVILKGRVTMLTSMAKFDESTLLSMFQNESLPDEDRMLSAELYLTRMKDSARPVKKELVDQMLKFAKEYKLPPVTIKTVSKLQGKAGLMAALCTEEEQLKKEQEHIQKLISDMQAIAQKQMSPLPIGMQKQLDKDYKELISRLNRVIAAADKKAASTKSEAEKTACEGIGKETCEALDLLKVYRQTDPD